MIPWGVAHPLLFYSCAVFTERVPQVVGRKKGIVCSQMLVLHCPDSRRGMWWNIFFVFVWRIRISFLIPCKHRCSLDPCTVVYRLKLICTFIISQLLHRGGSLINNLLKLVEQVWLHVKVCCTHKKTSEFKVKKYLKARKVLKSFESDS